MMTKRFGLFFIGLLAFLFAAAVTDITAASPPPVVFLPQWVPQAQFAGYYMAQEKGFYAQRGINVDILRGGADHPPLEYLAERKADFVSDFLVNALQIKSEGLDLVNIAQIVQHSSLVLVAKKSSGITKPEDMNGKKISIWSHFSVQPKAFIRKFNLDVKIVPQGYSMNLLLRDAVAVSSAMWYNEYHTLINSGLDEEDLQVFFFEPFGLNFPEDGIYCRRETLQADRQRCCDFVNATLEGWKYAFANPKETLDVVMRHVREANLSSNRMHQQWMLNRMKDIIQPPGHENALGVLPREDFDIVVQEMLANQMIQTPPNFAEFYENCADQ